jgi:hypothetical protein
VCAGFMWVGTETDFAIHMHVSTYIFVLYTPCPIRFSELHVAPIIIVPGFYSSEVWGKRSLAYLGAIPNPVNTNRFASNAYIYFLKLMLISPRIGGDFVRGGIVAIRGKLY